MTTIVANQTDYGSIIMCDSALNFESEQGTSFQTYSPPKMFKRGDTYIGVAGDVKATIVLETWVEFPTEFDDLEDYVRQLNNIVCLNEAVQALEGTWSLVAATKYGIAAADEDWAWEPPEGYWAIGTGQLPALSVLTYLDRTGDLGDSAVARAMDLAIQMDPYSCGPVITERVRND